MRDGNNSTDAEASTSSKTRLASRPGQLSGSASAPQRDDSLHLVSLASGRGAGGGRFLLRSASSSLAAEVEGDTSAVSRQEPAPLLTIEATEMETRQSPPDPAEPGSENPMSLRQLVSAEQPERGSQDVLEPVMGHGVSVAVNAIEADDDGAGSSSSDASSTLSGFARSPGGNPLMSASAELHRLRTLRRCWTALSALMAARRAAVELAAAHGDTTRVKRALSRWRLASMGASTAASAEAAAFRMRTTARRGLLGWADGAAASRDGRDAADAASAADRARRLRRGLRRWARGAVTSKRERDADEAASAADRARRLRRGLQGWATSAAALQSRQEATSVAAASHRERRLRSGIRGWAAAAERRAVLDANLLAVRRHKVTPGQCTVVLLLQVLLISLTMVNTNTYRTTIRSYYVTVGFCRR